MPVRQLSATFSASFRPFWRTNGGQIDVHKPTKMSIEISGKVSRNGQKTWYTFEWGKGTGQRVAAGVYTFTSPKDQTQKNHNKQALDLLETKKSQMNIDQQSIGTPFIPAHRFKHNFLDFYAEFVENNKREGNRHLQGSLNQFKQFIKKPRILPMEITENLCSRFRTYLLGKFTGKTPSDYLHGFKRVLKCATKEGYYRINPMEDIKCKTNPSKKVKDFLEADEYILLIKEPIINTEIRDAFIFCCYQGLRWCDVKNLQWDQVNGAKVVTRIIQRKTGKPVELTLHPVAQAILDSKKKKLENRGGPNIFHLPTHDGANKSLGKWAHRAGIDKDITWHSARLSFSILLQDAKVDTATVALLLGHTTTRHVNETYKRHRPKNQIEHILKLPAVAWEYN